MAAARVPLVALVHPGGEHIAIEITAAGGSAIVAEGNEEAILTVLSGETGRGDLIDAYSQRSDRSAASVPTTSIHDRDPITNLPGVGALEDRLGTMAQTDLVPRYGAVSVLGCDSVRLGSDAATLLGRRLGTQLNRVCRFHGATLFSVGRGDFAVVAKG